MATVKDLTDITITSDGVGSWSEYNMSDLNTTWLTGASGSNGYTYTTTGTGAVNPWITTDTLNQNSLSVKGDAEFDGDITVKGRSLAEFMESVEQRLNILRPNPDLEAEWDQLRALGEQYRELEKQLTEKSQMWATLKK